MAPASLSHCKLCDLEDFKDRDLRVLIREIFSSDRKYFARRFPYISWPFPSGREYRKYWEVAMSARAFEANGVLRPDATVLGVGAGHEATIYWLTEKVGRVFATDLYLTEDEWSDTDSGAQMLADPGRFWDGPWDPKRLVVHHMDARELRYPDESFDGIFSSSSIEHFGELDDVRRSVEEMYRVLRPGGIAAIATEFLLEGPTPGWEGLHLFERSTLTRLLLDGLHWELASPFDTTISQKTLRSPVDLQEALTEQASGKRGWSQYPHIVLRDGPFLWTSVHLALLKPADSATGP
jgi:SAM-dependent methyltransferase